MPFASRDILILVFGNHGEMNRWEGGEREAA